MNDVTIKNVRTQKRAARASKRIKAEDLKIEPPKVAKTEEKISVNFLGKESLLVDLETFDGDKSWMDTFIEPCLHKFGQQFNFTFAYISKFKAFRCFRDDKHVDWITLNDLLKRYDTGVKLHFTHIPPIQRPTKRVYD